MSVITAYKCDETGKLFEDKALYRKHLAKIARHRRAQAKLQLAEEARENTWLEIRSTISSISELEQFIVDHQDKFWAEAAMSAGSTYEWSKVGKATRKGVIMPIPKLIRFTKFNLAWSKGVSNSHNCPKGGKTNWGSYNKGAPTGYPGWEGTATWEIEWPTVFDGWYHGSDLFGGDNVCIHTGSGGGGGMKAVPDDPKVGIQTFSYSIQIFAADWPGLYEAQMRKEWVAEENRKRAALWKHLGGTSGAPANILEIPEDWVVPDVWNLT